MLFDRHVLGAIADFGEIATLLPAALAVALALVAAGRMRDAAAWTTALAGCIALTVALKAAFASDAFLGGLLHAPGFPSGHAALAIGFYGTIALLALEIATPVPVRRLLSGALAALGGAVLYAVWRLHWHTTLDLIGGGTIGLATMLAFQATAARGALPGRAGILALAAAAAVVVVLHGSRLQYEPVNATMVLRIVAL